MNSFGFSIFVILFLIYLRGSMRITCGCKPSRASGLLGMFAFSFHLPCIILFQNRFRSGAVEPVFCRGIVEQIRVPEGSGKRHNGAVVIWVARLAIPRQGALGKNRVFSTVQNQLVLAASG
jgi:hypothetical protein